MRNIGSHNSRENYITARGDYGAEPPEWVKNPDKVRLNIGELQFEDETINAGWHKAVQEAGLKRKPQTNSSVGIEAVFSATKTAFMTDEAWKEYLTDCKEWAEKKLGKENVLQWNFHFDETTPHLHMILIPIVRDQKKGNKYSSGHFLGGPEGLRNIQKELAEQVGQKYKLLRGIEGSKEKHTDQSEWQSKLVKKENELKEKEHHLKKEEDTLNKKVKYLEIFKEKGLKEVEEKKEFLEKKEIELDEREGKIKELEKLEEKSIRGFILEATKGKTPEFVKRVVEYIKKELPEFVKTCTQNVMSNKDRTPTIERTHSKGFKI